jgi:hypothetical protein
MLNIASHIPGGPRLNPLPTLSQLFNCFVYGAHILHSRSLRNQADAKLLRELFDGSDRHALLGHLYGGLKDLLNPISAIGVQVYQDFNGIQKAHNLPAPDVYWQNQLFTTPKNAKS